MSDAFDLYPGKALITGGGSGLGFAIAQALTDVNRSVIITGRDQEKLKSAVEVLGPTAAYVVCDSADEESVNTLKSSLDGIDISILINNAGVGGPVKPLADISASEWDDVFSINVRGVFLMCRSFSPTMCQRKNGFILNIASVTGKRPLENRTPYAASKMAVIGLTSTLSFELGTHGVMVNSLSPGPIVSERMDRNFSREAEVSNRSVEDVTKEFVSRSALRRMVTLEETAQAAASMLTIPGLTGTDLDFSGGMIA